jgi:hypothetical protein
MESYVLPIHFGNLQGKHEINTDSLLTFVEAYKEIAEAFGLNTNIQIGVPEEGGWKTNLTIGAGFILGVINFMGIDNLSILFTGKESKEWFYDAHNRLQLISEFLIQKAEDTPETFPKECIQQKNKIYQQFQKDDCIDSFRMGDFPAIPKNNFHLYIKEVPDEEFLYLGETNITVHSPDWKGKRSWRGKIEILEDKESAFDFEKDLTGKFWEMVKLDGLPLHTTDVMRVQLVKRPANKVKFLVIRVLTYNNIGVDSLLSDNDVRKLAVFDILCNNKEKSPQLELWSEND